ncbi:MAG: NAD(P)-dependent glycerol-3-phosphate dehydrogenase [Acidimicrobiia bacterium]|nr:NAD(P)-dependent glycerol-3-phosphate dehydrogenase [Acidimicrobiia bacterium]
MRRIAVIGAGSWGTAAAWLASSNAEVILWSRRAEVADAINQTRENARYLPGRDLPETLIATHDLRAAVDGADLIVIAVPSHGFRDVFREMAGVLPRTVPLLSLTKGIEQNSLSRMTEIIAQVDEDHDLTRVGVLTGPNLASEIAAEQPTAAVVAMRDGATAIEVQSVFMSPLFRVYTNDDVVGCELGGALKNVMAIAAGMSDGLGFGDNTRATLITRALAELTRLGVQLGGKPSTFAGLAGMGDLIATCVSHRSRNHQVGFGLATGKSLDEISAEMDMVAEGVKTTRAVLDLAQTADVEMPIASQVGQVLYEGVDPRQAMLTLMTREAKPEYL